MKEMKEISYNLFDLLGDNFFENYIGNIIDDKTNYKIERDIFLELTNIGIYVYPNDIEVTINNGININISPELNQKLIIFEEENPEYFI